MLQDIGPILLVKRFFAPFKFLSLIFENTWKLHTFPSQLKMVMSSILGPVMPFVRLKIKYECIYVFIVPFKDHHQSVQKSLEKSKKKKSIMMTQWWHYQTYKLFITLEPLYKGSLDIHLSHSPIWTKFSPHPRKYQIQLPGYSKSEGFASFLDSIIKIII